jgi:hypothetical protein
MSDTKETKSKSKEVDWTKGISNETVCQYFYVIFFIIATLATLLIIRYLMIPKQGPLLALSVLPSMLIAVLNTLFFYIVCARSLLK